MTQVLGSRGQPGAFFFLKRKALKQTRTAQSAVGTVEKPSQKPLRLSHHSHSADGDPPLCRRQYLITLQTQNSRYSLHHVYNLETLRMAYFSLKKEAAPGVDGETWRHYGEKLEENLQELSERRKRGAYRAKPVRRVYIPKADGRQRPLGVTALEDKIVQRAAVEVMNAIYETDFLGFSYGFRPGRSQHQALDALYTGLMTRKVNWVLDLDIRGFFDGISHEWLVKFIEHRVADQRVVRLIQKWWRAGVREDGKRIRTEEGPPKVEVPRRSWP